MSAEDEEQVTVALRLTRSLHTQLIERAADEDRSMSARRAGRGRGEERQHRHVGEEPQPGLLALGGIDIYERCDRDFGGAA